MVESRRVGSLGAVGSVGSSRVVEPGLLNLQHKHGMSVVFVGALGGLMARGIGRTRTRRTLVREACSGEGWGL